MTFRTFIFLILSLFVGGVVADGVPQVVQDKAAELIPDRSPDSVSATPVAGLYEVTFGTQVVYLFEDGQHLLSGDLIDLVFGVLFYEYERRACQ